LGVSFSICYNSDSHTGKRNNQEKQMTKMTPKQLAKWLKAQPDNLDYIAAVYGSAELTLQQADALLAKVSAAKQGYSDLYLALEKADFSLAGIANDCAFQNVEEGRNLTDNQLGYWGAMWSALASAAGDVWQSYGRHVNEETGMSVY
jgi:hypothetical protein